MFQAMSEYMFGLGRGNVPAALADRINKIAKRHGACFTNPKLPGEGWRYWFACPNLGFPFDKATAEAVFADLRAAGIADEDNVIKF